MPLHSIQRLSSTAVLGLWHLTETPEELWHLLPQQEAYQALMPATADAARQPLCLTGGVGLGRHQGLVVLWVGQQLPQLLRRFGEVPEA